MKYIFNLSAGFFFALIIMAFLVTPNRSEAFSKDIIRGNGDQYSYYYNYRQAHGYNNNYGYGAFDAYKSRALDNGFHYDNRDTRKYTDFGYNQDYQNRGCFGAYSCKSYNLYGWGYR